MLIFGSVLSETFVFIPSQGSTGSPGQPSVAKRKKLAAESVFNRFDDDEVDEAPRKRKLVPLDYEDEEKGADVSAEAGGKGANTEEKRKHIKSLIEKIPTAKPELFNYPLDWSVVDTVRKLVQSNHLLEVQKYSTF